MTTIPPMFEAIRSTKQRYAFQQQPFFRALREGSMHREDFVETQIQFLSAVVFFSRPMAALVSRLPHPGKRWAILKNISEEHGDGDFRLSHEQTFLLFLERLGVPRWEIQQRVVGPEVRTFNLALWGLTAGDDVWIAAAALGMIEDLFSEISAFLGDAILATGWLQATELVHYKTHATLDIEHAAEFYSLLEEAYLASPETAERINGGFDLGAYLFLQMYQGLYQARMSRRVRTTRGPVSLADGWLVPPEEAG